jgi:hypothetical protein
MATPEYAKDELAFAAQDKQWTAPKFIGLAFITLLVAISLIVFASKSSGCTLAWVP